MSQKIKIAILIGTRSDEYISCLTIGEYVFPLLNREKYEVRTIRVTPDGKSWLFPKEMDVILPKNLDEANPSTYDTLRIGAALDKIIEDKIDIVFLATPGGIGEDGSLQGFFQTAGIRYTSSGVLASALAMDKYRTHQAYETAGLNNIKTLLFNQQEWEKNPKKIVEQITKALGFPCFIKPCMNGSSIGAGPVHQAEELSKRLEAAFSKGNTVLAQELIQGREFTCAVLDNGEGNPLVLTPTELMPTLDSFVTFEMKHVLDHGLNEKNPPDLPEERIKEIQSIVLTAHQALGCTGMSRTDVLMSEKTGQFYPLETNTIPGITAASIYSKIIDHFGLTMSIFFDRIIQSGLNREMP